MMIRVVPSAAVGEVGADLIRSAIDDGDVNVLGVATGSSPLPLYRALGARPPRRASRLTLFALDEYVGIRRDHPESYHSVVEREISGPLGVPRERVFVPEGDADDLELACASYERAIAAAGGIDLQILGVGSNGHIAFNEPGSAADTRTRVLPLTEQTRVDNSRFFSGLDAVPTHCVTQGIGTILEARSIVLVARGLAKAEAVARSFGAPPDPSWPASYLQHHPDVTLILDEDAASLLTLQGALS